LKYSQKVLKIAMLPLVVLLLVVPFFSFTPFSEASPSQVAYVYYGSESSSFQRRNFWANGYYRQFYVSEQTYNFEYKGSSDDITWNNLTVIAGDVADEYVYYDYTSVWLENDTFVHLVFVDYNSSAPGGQRYTISYQTATLGVGSISLGTRQTVCTLVGERKKPTVTVDSNGYPWVGYTVVSSNGYFVRKSSAKDGSSWGSETQLFTAATTTYYMSAGVIVPLASGKMYVCWEDSHPYESALGRLYNGTGWEGNKTIRPALTTGATKSQNRFSVVVKSNFDVVFYYDELTDVTNNGTHVYTYNYGSDSWSYTKWVSTQGMVGSVTINKTTNDMWFFYTHTHAGSYVVGDGIYYEKYINLTNTWGSETTVNSVVTSLCDLHGFYEQSSGHLGVAYVASNYLYFISVTENKIPTIGEFQAPTIVYANKYFFLNATINDEDGVTDFDYTTIEISNSIILKWVNSSNTFSEQSDTNGYCTLDAAGSVRTSVNSTAYKFSWKTKLNWTFPEGSVNVVVTDTKVYDSQGAVGSGSQTGLFTFEDDLIVNSATVNDNRVNPSQSLTFIGQLYYEGTSTTPEDTANITAKVELSGTVEGSTTTVNSTGYFQIDFNAETSVANYSYIVYAVTDRNTVQNKTVYVVVDRAVVTISANTTSPAPNAYVNFTLTAIYDYDDQPITSWTVNTLKNSTHFDTGNFTDGGYTDTICIYFVENITENTYGLTSFTSNTVTVYWSTYVALTVRTVDLDSVPLTDAIVDFNGTQIAVDSNGLAIKSQIVKYDNITVKVKWQNSWVNGTWTINMTSTKTIETACNVWNITINENDNGGTTLNLTPVTVVWNFPNNTQINMTTSTGTQTFKIMNGTSYYQIQYQGQWVSQNITLNLIDYSQASNRTANIDCWVYSLTVYLQTTSSSPTPNVPITGATLTLVRNDSENLTAYYLTPQITAAYNLTHARYVWTQLANQTYQVTANIVSAGGPTSSVLNLTANESVGLQLVYPVGGGIPGAGGGPPSPSFPTLNPILISPNPIPIEDLLDKGKYAILLLIGISALFIIPNFVMRERKKKKSKNPFRKSS